MPAESRQPGFDVCLNKHLDRHLYCKERLGPGDGNLIHAHNVRKLFLCDCAKSGSECRGDTNLYVLCLSYGCRCQTGSIRYVTLAPVTEVRVSGLGSRQAAFEVAAQVVYDGGAPMTGSAPRPRFGHFLLPRAAPCSSSQTLSLSLL
jgi:hypothetical protein